MKKRIEWIDALKGIAILGIVCIHLENWTCLFADRKIIHQILMRGNLGVELTYICNAYLLMLKKNAIANSKKSWGGVLMNSVFRIIPLYFLYLFTFFILGFWGLFAADMSAMNVASHFLFLSILNPYWWTSFPGSGYVGVLVLLWLLFPFYERKVHTTEQAVAGFLLIVCVSFLLNAILRYIPIISDKNLWNDYLSYIFRGIQSFSFGIMLFYLPEIKNNIAKKKLFSCLLCIFSVLAAYLFIKCNATNMLFFFVIICFVMALQIFPVKLFCNPIFSFLGKYIFGIYICHITLYFFISYFVKNSFFIWSSVILGSVLLSVILTMLVERPCISLLKKIFLGRTKNA